jgi:uncharacterized membrane protein
MFKLLDGHERHWRSLAKAISWRTTGTIDTFIISYFISGRISIASTIAGVEVFTKILLFYFHERVWTLIPWGRGPLPVAIAERNDGVRPDFARGA